MDTQSNLATRMLPVFTLSLLFTLVPTLSAQSMGERERDRIQARISELEAQLVAGDRGAADIDAELARLRARLVVGDFRPGDAIVVEVIGEEALTDTFTVEVPRQLRLPGLEPIDLTGILTDELQPYLEGEVSRYVREPTVTAHPLIRLAVTGAVASPGYYMFRPSTLVLDVFGVAGGFDSQAKTNDVELKRSGKAIVGSDELRRAMAAGWSLQQLDVRSADEFYVPARGRIMNTREWVLTISGIVGLTVTALAIFR